VTSETGGFWNQWFLWSLRELVPSLVLSLVLSTTGGFDNWFNSWWFREVAVSPAAFTTSRFNNLWEKRLFSAALRT
jgi:hypothetical protein